MTIANPAAEDQLSHARYFATCARGIEPVLAAELRALGAGEVDPARGSVHFAGDRAHRSRDSVHTRGYRRAVAKAPLNEAVAAALVQVTGWKGARPFADPMCGSGVLPIEAAWIALNRPPGLTRRHFGFQGWMDFDIQLW